MNRKMILSMTMSLDGFIADESGGTDWISEYETECIDFVNEKFLNQVDTAVMGRKTYEKLSSEVSLDDWALPDIKCYVVTKGNYKSNESVEFVKNDMNKFVRYLKYNAGKDIWIVGGATFAQDLIRENLIDKFYITIVPTILGEGIMLFKNDYAKTNLHLDKCGVYDGMVLLQYSKAAI